MNNYFPHDSNARNSDKLIPLRARFGAEGYGIYFMLIERLREESSYMSVKDYNMLAFDLRVDTGKVKSVIEDFGLFAFTDDGKCFYSESLLRRMKVKDEKSEKARRSVASKWNNLEHQNAAKRSERLSAARKIATHTKEEWQEMKDIIGHCVMCGKSSDETMLVKDHIIPLYQGGSDGIDNIQPLCRSCNSRKGADSNDYRTVFCKSNGIKMPTKWLRNAYETPTIKVKESKGNNIERINSFSLGKDGGDTAAEKEKILEVFFFEKNCVDYLGEARRFFSHYEADGWRRKGNSVPVSDKVALARCWKVDTPVGRDSPAALGWYRSVYEKVKAARPEVARVMIRTVSTVSFAKTSECVDVVFSVKDKETASFIDDAFVHVLKGDDLLKGITLKYQICAC